jgi:hypothetical protein
MDEITLWHIIAHENVDVILQNGFTGEVLLTEVPLSTAEGIDGDTMLAVTLTVPLAELAGWEKTDGPCREWLVPAEAIHRLARVHRLGLGSRVTN